MNTVMAAVQRHRGHFLSPHERGDEHGASAVEYGLLISGIAAVIALAVYAFGGGVLDLFVHTCDTVGSAAGAGSC